MRARFNSNPMPEAARGLKVERAWSQFADRLPRRDTAPERVKNWFERLMTVLPGPDGDPEDLGAKAAFVFGFDAEAARAEPANHAVLTADSARVVLAELAERARVHEGPVRPQEFEDWLNEIAAATGVRGGELARPARIALTGACAGADLGSIVLLIEDPAARELGIPSVRDRIERFVGV